jgi:WD40 repeat protein
LTLFVDIPLSTGPAQVIPSSSDKLESIHVYEDLIFAGYHDDYILILRISDSNIYTYEHLISVKYKAGDSTPIDSFIVYNKQLWISTGCIVYIFNVNNTDKEHSYNLLMKKPVDEDHLITMIGFSGYIWAGSLRGNVYVFRMDNYELYKTFAGHHDSVCILCSMLDMYVFSGSAQNDTSIAIWENVQTLNGGTTAKPSTFDTHGRTNSSRIPKVGDSRGAGAKSIDKL